MNDYCSILKKYVVSESEKYTQNKNQEIVGFWQFPDPAWRVCCEILPDGISYSVSHRFNVGRLVQRLPTIHAVLSSFAKQKIFGEVTVSIGDKPSFEEPCLTFSSSKSYDYLIPDPYFCRTQAYEEEKKNIKEHWIPLRDREDIVFWRGAMTGDLVRQDGRFNIVYQVNKLHDPTMNVKFAATEKALIEFVENRDSAEHILPLDGDVLSAMVDGRVPFLDFLKYKWQLDLDGNSNAWDSMFKKLLLGGPVIKIGSTFKQWYYDRIIEQGVVRWASSVSHIRKEVQELDPEFAQEVGEQGRVFASEMTVLGEIENCSNSFSKKSLSLYRFAEPVLRRLSDRRSISEKMLLQSQGDVQSFSDNLYRNGFRQEAFDVFQRGVELFPPKEAEKLNRMKHLQRLAIRLTQAEG